MVASVVIGRDILRAYGMSLASFPDVTEKDAISEILNIDVCETESKITDTLQINSEIPQGYLITDKEIRPTDSGIDAVVKFPIPKTVRDVQSFIGLCSYFRKFIEGLSITAKPLYDLLKKNAVFKFSEAALNAFDLLKSKLVTNPILAIYDPKDKTELHCDASALGFGAVLMHQKHDLKMHPFFYFSMRTTNAESIHFKIITDCNSVKLTLQKKEINPRIAKWAIELSNYDYSIEHRANEKMRHVDALSRAVDILIVEDNPLEYNLSVCQTQDKNIKEIIKKLETTEDRLFEMRNGLVYRKRGTELLFYVPQNMEKHILFQYHDQMGHLGIEKTVSTISRSYWFPNVRQKVEIHVLDEIEYASNNTVNKSTGETPSRLLFGIDQRGQVNDEIKEYVNNVNSGSDRNMTEIRSKASEKMIASQEYNKKYFDSRHKKPHEYKVGDYVMLRNFDNTRGVSRKLMPQFKGPYVILKELRNDRYVVGDIDGFQNSQKRYQGVWEPKNRRPWVMIDSVKNNST
ncbi:Transposon Tf2-9 polyprotein [Anthophora quadrimaculata]